MDSIINELDKLIKRYEFDDKVTDVACYNKIKMDYFLMLTIAATWDLKRTVMDRTNINDVMKCLQRPETGKLIRLIDSKLNLDKSIVNIFDVYKENRNLRFGHTTFDEFEAKRLNKKCKQCWDRLMQLKAMEDSDSDLIRRLYQEDNDFYYIRRVKQNGNMFVEKFGGKDDGVEFPKINMKARLSNKTNDIQEGDLYLSVNDQFIKVSPFIQYNDKEELFLMLMDIEICPLTFKMAYIYRTQYANESSKYLDEFPRELRGFFPEESKKLRKNGIRLNKFSQYELFEQEYYQGVHRTVQTQLDEFISGNMAYGAVRGVGGVGKTSAVFMWINRILNNEEGILNLIRQKFDLRYIVFLSAKTKIYSREINVESLSNLYDIESDISSYQDVIEYIYAIFHPFEKKEIKFEDKVDYIKNYSDQLNNESILIIIDDYESLEIESREKIQKLKDSFKPNVIKMLITTRFSSKESKDIIVESLNEDDCARMTDHIFGSSKWRTDLKPAEMRILTGGLPLLIWYAKAYFQQGQLSSKRLKSNFSGPVKGLEGYLYDNFVQCFEDEFTKNFLMIATKYYKVHNVLQISKKTAVFLCLKNPKEYKIEDEEFYFRELTDLKLISINQTTNSINFSPLMIYMDRTSKKQEPEEQYQSDSLKVLDQLDEEQFKDLCAVIRSAEYLENETKCRILNRIIEFSQSDEKIKIIAIGKIFALSSDKIKLYEQNTQIFQNNQELVEYMLDYLVNNERVIKEYYNLIRDFVFSISISMKNQNIGEQVASKGVNLVSKLLEQSLEEREFNNITNSELKKRAQLLIDLANKFIHKMQDMKEKQEYMDKINDVLEEVSIYCRIIEI